jgi:hypothetical protein
MKQPNDEQMAALQRFAQLNGRRWKTVLWTAWINGSYRYVIAQDGDDKQAIALARNDDGDQWKLDWDGAREVNVTGAWTGERAYSDRALTVPDEKQKTIVWVLSTCVPGNTDPCWPQIFGSETAVRSAYRKAMESEWAINGPEDEITGERLPFPDDADDAHERIAEVQGTDWGRWELTRHEIDVES